MFDTLIGKIITHLLAAMLGAFTITTIIRIDFSDNFWIITATCTIAIFTVVTVLVQAHAAHHQEIASRADWKKSLHNERIKIFETLSSLSTIVQTVSDGTEYDALREADYAASKSNFYFPEVDSSFLREIVEKSMKYTSVQRSIQSKQKNQNASPQEISLLMTELLDIAKWLSKNSSREKVMERLSQHLKLPTNL